MTIDGQNIYELILQKKPLIVSAAQTVLDNRMHDDDILSDICLLIIRRKPDITDEIALNAYIRRAAIFGAKNIKRKFRREQRIEPTFDVEDQSTNSEQPPQKLIGLKGAIDQLSADDRLLIEMWMEAFSFTQIAAKLNISEAACRQRKRRILRQIKKNYRP